LLLSGGQEEEIEQTMSSRPIGTVVGGATKTREKLPPRLRRNYVSPGTSLSRV